MVVILVLVTTAVFTLWAKVPFVPTPRRTGEAMLKAADLKGDETIYDLGAGDGRLLIRAKRAHPGIKAVGYEIVPFVWFLGRLRVLFSREDVTLQWGNALTKDIRDADCVFVYLITELMPLFEKKFNEELKPGTKVISHAFKFPEREPKQKLVVPEWIGRKRIYVYEW